MLNQSPIPSGCNSICPACRHRSWSLQESLQQKGSFIYSKLNVVIEEHNLLEKVVFDGSVRSLPEHQRLHYRNKVLLRADFCLFNEWHFGVTRFKEFVPIDDCPVHSLQVKETLTLLRATLPKQTDYPLYWLSQTGAQVTLVFKTSSLPSLDWITPEFKERFFELGNEGLWIHLNPSTGKRVFGKGYFSIVFGQEASLMSDGLAYGPAAFQQLIPELHSNSLDEAESWLLPDSKTAVLDLYSGNGASLRRWIAQQSVVLGIESSGDSVRFSLVNASGAQVLRGSCLQRVPQIDLWRKANEKARFLVYTNPPRTGMEPEVTAYIGRTLRPERIAYMSCSPGTLARDLLQLRYLGYRLCRVIGYDFFPLTHHVETLALLERVNGSDDTL